MVRMAGPLVEVARLQNEINKIFESLRDVSPEQTLQAVSAWVPSVDVRQTARHLVVSVELPGVDGARLRVAAGGGQVLVTGEKRRPGAVRGARFHCLERAHGRFARTVHLPVPVNTHQATAVLRDGLLTITFPRVPNRRGEGITIPVKLESSGG